MVQPNATVSLQASIRTRIAPATKTEIDTDPTSMLDIEDDGIEYIPIAAIQTRSQSRAVTPPPPATATSDPVSMLDIEQVPPDDAYDKTAKPPPEPPPTISSAEFFNKSPIDGEEQFFKDHGIQMPDLPEQFPHLRARAALPIYPSFHEIKPQLQAIKYHSQWINKIVPQYAPHVEFPDISHIAKENFVIFKKYIYMFCEFADVFQRRSPRTGKTRTAPNRPRR